MTCCPNDPQAGSKACHYPASQYVARLRNSIWSPPHLPLRNSADEKGRGCAEIGRHLGFHTLTIAVPSIP
jgi:hypothetical protein